MCAVGSTVRLLLSRQGGWGSTIEIVLPDYSTTMSSHDSVASKYPVEVMVQAVCSAAFSIPKPRGIWDG